MSDEAVGCKHCGRAVYARHVDEHGLCSECRPAALERAAKAEARAEARVHAAEEKAAEAKAERDAADPEPPTA